MLLKYFYDDRLAQASYMVGCAAGGVALVVDPARDIHPYLDAAQAEGLRIAQVVETHIHADYASGSRELAQHTGAALYLSKAGDADWQYAFATDQTILVTEGDEWNLGNIRLQVLHTPGHTPEHISLLVTDTAAANEPMGLFSGDFIFVGDVGRPDLLEAAAGIANTKVIGARQQFASLQRIKSLPDYLQVWPGHGAGSACGKALGAIPSTTLGYEKRFNPAFQFNDEQHFVDWLLADQPEVPRYFGQMKHLNRDGPALLNTIPAPRQVDYAALQTALDAGQLVIDFRSQEAFARVHLRGTVNIPATSQRFNTYVGWLVDYTQPLHFIAPSAVAVPEILTALRAIGVDDTPGYGLPDVIEEGLTDHLETITAEELAEKVETEPVLIVDVRGQQEYNERHIIDALNIPLGYISQRLDEIPQDRLVVTQCATGYRSQIAASLLRKYGYKNVRNLTADEKEWADVLVVVE